MWYFLDINMKPQKIAVGVAGAGVWAGRVHIPALEADPRFRIAGIWARRFDQAELLGARFGIEPIAEFEELVQAADIVDLVVAPAAQPGLALKAAREGRHLILEKPVGIDADELDDLRSVVSERRLAVRVFVQRFFDSKRMATIRSLSMEPWARARSEWRSSAFLPGNPFATPWRDADAVLYDIGPHSISQLEAILGRVQAGRITARTATSVTVALHHVGGAQSEVLIDVGADVPSLQEKLTLWTPTAEHEAELEELEARPAFGRLLDRLAADITRPEGAPDDPDDPTGLADGVRMVRTLGELAATWHEPVGESLSP